ncbi:MAG: hypothetical protein BGO59_24380 [Spirosoma sp. 48-14]|nr:MAG: hypothetical protein BGO59_24380 [Spirosoma sp. 48-14]
MVTFDQNGNLFPYSRIPLSLPAIETWFVIPFTESLTRKILFRSFTAYHAALFEVLKLLPQQ